MGLHCWHALGPLCAAWNRIERVPVGTSVTLPITTTHIHDSKVALELGEPRIAAHNTVMGEFKTLLKAVPCQRRRDVAVFYRVPDVATQFAPLTQRVVSK